MNILFMQVNTIDDYKRKLTLAPNIIHREITIRATGTINRRSLCLHHTKIGHDG